MTRTVSDDGSTTTTKGRQTRARIVAAAAELMYRHGVAGTTTPAVRDAAGVSSSQIYHYFTDKDDLVRAVIAHQADAVVAAQLGQLSGLDSLAGLRAWRDAMVDVARVQHGSGGCPLGSLTGELADAHTWARAALAAGFDRWTSALRAGLGTLVDNGTLDGATDVDRLALALLAAIQGGLLLAQAHRTTAALEAGLDAVLAQIDGHRVHPVRPTRRRGRPPAGS